MFRTEGKVLVGLLSHPEFPFRLPPCFHQLAWNFTQLRLHVDLMNRLRKTSESPQKSAASSGTTLSNAVTVRPPLQVNPPALSQTYKTALQPRTSAEQYWAARALTAETLLSARLEHHRELRSLSYAEETKRAVRDFLFSDAYLILRGRESRRCMMRGTRSLRGSL
jgi:hypothetical protein